jgi:polar amino acid transport system substrate-binding protein
MKWKYGAAAVSAVLVMLVTTACGSGSSSASDPDKGSADSKLAALLPQDVRDRGSLTVAAEVYPPVVIQKSASSPPEGWEPAIAARLGELLGIDFKIQIVPFDSIIPGLQGGRFDIAMGGITVTPDRRKVVGFVTHVDQTDSFMAKKGSGLDLSDEMALCGQKTAVLAGSLELDYVKSLDSKCAADGKDSISIQTYKTQDDVNTAINAGRADVSVAASTTLKQLTDKQPDLFEYGGKFNVLHTGIAVADNADTAQLSKALSAGVNEMISDGSYQQILDKWNFGQGAISHSEVLPPR